MHVKNLWIKFALNVFNKIYINAAKILMKKDVKELLIKEKNADMIFQNNVKLNNQIAMSKQLLNLDVGMKNKLNVINKARI